MQNFYYWGSIRSRKNVAGCSDPRWNLSDWHLRSSFWFIKQEQNREGSGSCPTSSVIFWDYIQFYNIGKVFSASLLFRKINGNAIIVRKRIPELYLEKITNDLFTLKRRVSGRLSKKVFKLQIRNGGTSLCTKHIFKSYSQVACSLVRLCTECIGDH